MSLPFDAQQGLIVVQSELWGPYGSAVLRLALDTGATSTVVNVAMLYLPATALSGCEYLARPDPTESGMDKWLDPAVPQ